MTIWAYGIATVALFIGVHLMLKHKKWKIGSCIACLSLLVFLGGSLNIRNLISVEDAFKLTQQVSAISNEVARINMTQITQMTQSMVLTQQINQTVNTTVNDIVQVKKEIAGIRETIVEMYKRTTFEYIRSMDTNRLWFFDKPDGGHITFVRLEHCPIHQSISAMAQGSDVGQIPLVPNSINPFGNILGITWGASVNDYSNYSYAITYVIDPDMTNLLDKAERRGTRFYFDGEHLFLDMTNMMFGTEH